MEIERQIKLKDSYLDIIIGLAVDAEGCTNADELSGLIGAIYNLAVSAKNNDDESCIYYGADGEERNIFGEEIMINE